MSIDFNSYADAYQRNRSTRPKVLEALIAGCGLDANDSVLEVGCGTANYLAAIVSETGAAGRGVDPAAQMLAHARSDPARANLALSVASAEFLPYADSSFRFVYSVDVIHHVSDRMASANEAHRVLKPGGKLCTVTDSHEDIANRVPLSSHFPETIPHELDRYPPIETLQKEQRSAGFVDLNMSQVDHAYELADITPFRERAFSALRLISDEQFSVGLARLERELEAGPVLARSVYTLIWATRSS